MVRNNMDNELKVLKINVSTLAARLAQEKSENEGTKYNDCIGSAIDAACNILGVNKNIFIKMYL